MVYALLMFISLIGLSLFLKQKSGENPVVTASDVAFAVIPSAIILFYSPSLKSFSWKDGGLVIEKTVGEIIRDIQLSSIGSVIKRREQHTVVALAPYFQSSFPSDYCFEDTYDDNFEKVGCADGEDLNRYKTLAPIGESDEDHELVHLVDKQYKEQADKAVAMASIVIVVDGDLNPGQMANMAMYYNYVGQGDFYVSFYSSEMEMIAICHSYIFSDMSNGSDILKFFIELIGNYKKSNRLWMFIQSRDVDRDDCFYSGELLSESSTIYDAIEIFSKNNILIEVPVVDNKGFLFGTITRDNVVARALMDLLSSFDKN